MGYKGTLRKAAAAMNRAESDRRKRENALRRQQARLEKMEELERANYEVNLYESQMESLLDIHKESNLAVDWNLLLTSQPPNEPKNSNEKEKLAESEFRNYKPGILDKVFKKSESKKETLIDEMNKAKMIDEQNYQDALIQYKTDLEDWKTSVDLAERVLQNENKSFLEAITFFDPFSEIYNLGKEINFNYDSKILQANILVLDEEIIPSELKSILKSGKLSSKKISKSKINELYQDHVCSVVLRIARELFSLLPIDLVIVNAVGLILNTKTGYQEEKPILSVAFTKPILENLNFSFIDTSDAMENFVYKMNFKSTKGFSPIEVLNSEDFHNN